MSKAYFTTGVSSFFEMSTSDARRILPPHLHPVEIRPQQGILNVSAFHFRESRVGPYAELVFSVVVPPVVGGWSQHPKAGFFPFMAATTSLESRLLMEELRIPTHPEVIDTRFVERDDHMRVQAWCGGEPVVDLTVTLHEWSANSHLLHSYMMDGELRLKADVQISAGRYSVHEKELGRLTLHPHAITRHLSLDGVSASPFREHWLKEGCEEFRPLERI
jgi:hypothetical protein